MTTATSENTITLKNLTPFYGPKQALEPVNVEIRPHSVTAFIGPSGCGKTTVLRCINRMHELVPNARVQGQVFLGNQDIYGQNIEAQAVRRKIGMVFQQPVPVKMMSIYDNVAVGLKLEGRSKRNIDERVEVSLRAAALWDEVKDKLHYSGLALSGGQQQRMCIARAVALEPDVILMDEPCSALDPVATYKIEELLHELKKHFTVVIVTHNMQQAARVADRTCVYMVDRQGEKPIGFLVEEGETKQIFSDPRDPRTEEYISGRVG